MSEPGNARCVQCGSEFYTASAATAGDICPDCLAKTGAPARSRTRRWFSFASVFCALLWLAGIVSTLGGFVFVAVGLQEGKIPKTSLGVLLLIGAVVDFGVAESLVVLLAIDERMRRLEEHLGHPLLPWIRR